ncbi:MAG: class I SAM-dependent methyltransferase [Anaerolineae bacterium]|nr:class I SAM-dependent methyltransferase [Anaerolineae bacterium]
MSHKALEQVTDRHAQIVLSFAQDLWKNYHPRDFALRLWDGTTWGPEPGQPARFTIVLNHPGALRKMFFPPTDLSLGEAYIYGDFDIEGDFEAAFRMTDRLRLFELKWGPLDYLRHAWQLLQLPSDPAPARFGRAAVVLSGSKHSIARDRQAVGYHYDVPGDFYALWLDKRMVYSCAYFAAPGEALDAAQERKLDLICRKLDLKASERLLDIGCGWGGLIMYAAQRYGVEAHGITLSRPQVDFANARIREAGLQDRCRAEYRDYREISQTEQYDKIVSVGMAEHVGVKMLPEYFRQAWRLLHPGGLFMNHAIASDVIFYSPSSGFAQHYVFPDGELVSLDVTTRAAAEAGFEVRDVESLREHYALTLKNWVARLDAKKREVLRVVDEVTYRIWRIYMSLSRHGFNIRAFNVYQVLLSKPDSEYQTYLPLMRSAWYR